jgi:hypothetical protein
MLLMTYLCDINYRNDAENLFGRFITWEFAPLVTCPHTQPFYNTGGFIHINLSLAFWTKHKISKSITCSNNRERKQKEERKKNKLKPKTCRTIFQIWIMHCCKAIHNDNKNTNNSNSHSSNNNVGFPDHLSDQAIYLLKENFPPQN